MNKAAIEHRPESEYAYLYRKGEVHLRLKTGKEIQEVFLLWGDPYELDGEQWLQEKRKMKLVAKTNEHFYWQVSVHPPYRRLKYAFEVCDETECIFYGDRGIYPLKKEYYTIPNFYFSLPYLHEVDAYQAPVWVKETVWYQIFPERFANGDSSNDPEGTLPWGSTAPTRENFFGGDLQGIIDHLDDLEKLGVNGLYLCPIFCASSNHKYDTWNYFMIDPQFGTKEDLQRLVQEAHQRGMKVMLDAVFNHSGDQVAFWQEVQHYGKDSLYYSWYHIEGEKPEYQVTENAEVGKNLNYDTFAFNPHMPKWNTAHPKVQEYLLQAATYWIEEADIDAWRLDVANEVDHRFWRKFQEACVKEKKDIYLLGEIWHSAQPWLQGDQFHGTMNYAYCESIVQYFVQKEIDEEQFISVLYQQLMLYQDEVNRYQLNLLDSHDTERILTQMKGNVELLEKVFAFLFLQPGTPCLYYGTEIGMEGGPDPLNRACMNWDKSTWNQSLWEKMHEMILWRKKYAMILSDGTIEFQYDKEREQITVVRARNKEKIIGCFAQGKEGIVVEKDNKIAGEKRSDGTWDYILWQEKEKNR
ncbi:glycoside hydrolase family 13 protein [Catellicoccus marimammalium]|uniref:Neopullulanase n=1 Tax=Catellicoccus marimammalium M35/04/3 TaxID=1234409 RepID=K8Z7C3_9ENTE|nr:glycoside hydrolase family 13 protein [Catellicoccus marimammalium]EKU26919.1 Neopullulanase [Catellicoccus marimammalium M35/04/3]